MTYDLFIGDQSFSSWSLRGWLMLEKFGLPYDTHLLGLYAGTLAADLAPLAPARTVPVLCTPDGAILTDSIAMAETLAEAHPDLGFWPDAAEARGLARSMVAEMHAGFGALRADCPMNLRTAWAGFVPRAEVLADVARIESLWALAREYAKPEGPWLFGSYTLADAFYAPVAAHMATYGLAQTDVAKAYVQTTLSDPAFRAWRAQGEATPYDPMPYQMDLPKADWPGPASG